MVASIRDGIPRILPILEDLNRGEGMPKKWEEIGELVLKNQDRFEDHIQYLIKGQTSNSLKIATGVFTNIIYGLISVILGTIISILMQRYL